MAGRRINGGVYGAINVPSRNKLTGGIYSSAEAYNARMTDSWANSYTNGKTVMLLKDNGVDGAQNNTFVDSSSNNTVATKNGNVTQGTFGPYGTNWSVVFDGNGDYLTAPGGATLAIGTNDFTIEFFVNLNAVNTIQGLVDFRPLNGTGVYPNLYLTAAGAIVYDIGEVVRITSTTLSASVWYHVAVCRSNGITKMFLNGVQVGNNYTDTNNYIVAASRPSIGASGWSLTFYAAGLISNLHVTSGAVGSGAALYTSNFVIPSQNISRVATTVLLCCASNRFKDLSTNNHAITPAGNAAISAYSPFVTAINDATNVGSMYFDGTGDYINYAVQTGFIFGTGDFTIEGWFYVKSLATGICAIDFRPLGVNGVYPIMAFNTDGTVEYASNSVTNIKGGSLVINSWNHVAISRSSLTSRLFLNGVQIGTGYTDNLSYSAGASRPNIGMGGAVANSYPMSGYASDIRIVKGTAVYTANFTPPTSALTAITNTSLLLNCKPQAIYDAAGISTCETVGNAQASARMISAPTGNSIYFDGTGDYITSNAPAAMALGTGDFTIEGWFNVSSLAANRMLFDFRPQSTQGAYFAVAITSAGKIQYYVSSAERILTSTVLTVNTWYHVAFVRTTANNTTKIYINGIADANTYTDTTNYGVGATRPVIGALGDSIGLSPYIGLINDFRITKGRAVYTAPFFPPTDALLKESDTVLLLSSKQTTITDITLTNTLTVVGDTKVIQTPRKTQRNVMYFDGTGDYLTFDGRQELALGTGDFTIEMWVCPTSIPATVVLFDFRPAGGNGFYPCVDIAATTNYPRVWINSTYTMQSTTTVPLNIWSHICLVRLNGVLKLFQNGVATVTVSDTNNYLVGTARPIIGANGNSIGTSPYTGYIDDLRILKGTALYKSNFAPPVQPLTVI